MFGLGKNGGEERYGVVVDVGSASITIAIVASDPNEELPKIIWSYKERMAVSNKNNILSAAKNIATATINAFLMLGSEGLLALKSYDKTAKVVSCAVAISAPWSYTVTKTISSSDTEPFVVTNEIINKMIITAKQQATSLIENNEVFEKLGLEVISEATISIEANGYNISHIKNQEVNELAISHVTNIVQKHLVDVIRESHGKIIPKAELSLQAFMFNSYLALRALTTDIAEICIIDVSGDATEIAIVRDGILTYVTHMPYGHYSLAREVSDLCGIPYEEALGSFKSNSDLLKGSLSKVKQEEYEVIIKSYVEKASDLFKRTGDSLSIPDTIFMHTDTKFEDFFAEQLNIAAKNYTKKDNNIHQITSKFFGSIKSTETRMLLSAFVFHKNLAIKDTNR